MEKVKIDTDFIKLDQFMKWVGIVESGVEAKYCIQDGEVLVNGEIETRRGKKLYAGDKIKFREKEYIVEK